MVIGHLSFISRIHNPSNASNGLYLAWYSIQIQFNSKELYCHTKHCILHTDTWYGTQQFYQVNISSNRHYLKCTGNYIVGMRYMKKTCLYVARRCLQDHNRICCSNEGWRSSIGLMDPRTMLYNEVFFSSGLTIYYWSKTTTRAEKEQP